MRRVAKLTWMFGALVAALCSVPLAAAVGSAQFDEIRAHDVVARLFEDGIYTIAEQEAADFLRAYPNSRWAGEVALIQARSCMMLGRRAEAVDILDANASRAGNLADEFLYWRAVAEYEQGAFDAAAKDFGRLARSFPKSRRRLEALYREAEAWFRAGNAAAAARLLQDPQGLFQKLAGGNLDNEWAARGWLLLAEALLAEGNLTAAEGALETLAGRALPVVLDWQRRYLAARVRLAENRLQEALGEATNLWTVATNLIQPELRAAAAAMHAGILERLKKPKEAVQAYERNLSPDLPLTRRREALERIVQIGEENGLRPQVVALLEQFVKQRPGDPLLDLVRLSLGELLLANYRDLIRTAGETPPPTQTLTNLLARARAQFEALIRERPRSEHLGRAYWDLGWCLWEAARQDYAPAAKAFSEAVRKLPPSRLQAEARFKLADCLLRMGRPAEAMSNYWAVATGYAAIPKVREELGLQALAQAVEAAVAAGNLDRAREALNRLHKADPEGKLAGRAQLLLADAFTAHGGTEEARALYSDFAKRFPKTPLAAEAALGMARTYERDQRWDQAAKAYADWLERHKTDTKIPAALAARALFNLGRIRLQTEGGTNAVALLTQFLKRFPKDENVPLAHYLLGEHYFRHGNYADAELQFLDPSLAPRPENSLGELPYRARLMAGRAAVARQSYSAAREHFDWVITNGPLHTANSRVPPSVVAEAYILRGDTFLLEKPARPEDAFAGFGEAITAFSRVAEHFPTNQLAPLAWGRIGDCQLQLAAGDPRRYRAAAAAYRKAMSPQASVSVRSMAEAGLAVVLEKEAALRPEMERWALLRQALDHCLAVCYGKNLRDGEQPDPYWLKQTGLSALRLAKRLGDREVFEGVCRRLIREMPPLKDRLERELKTFRAGKAPAKPAAGRGAS